MYQSKKKENFFADDENFNDSNKNNKKINKKKKVKDIASLFFHSSVATGSIQETGITITNELISKIKEIGEANIGSIVLDLVSTNKVAFREINNIFPEIITTHCCAHAANHLGNDIFGLKAQLTTGGCFKQPNNTRWGSKFDSILSVYENKKVLESLKENRKLMYVGKNEEYNRFSRLVKDANFWEQLKNTIEITKGTRTLVATMEKNHTGISQGIPLFSCISTSTADLRIKSIYLRFKFRG